MTSSEPNNDPQPTPRVRVIDTQSVPVFNCLVLVTGPNEQGEVRARCAVWEGIEAEGPSEREALQRVVTQFKQILQTMQSRGEPIHLLDPPLAARNHETRRWIPVHL